MIGAVMSKAKKLRELDLGRNFEYNEQALNFIKMTAKNLKRLQIYTRNLENIKILVERIHGDGLNCNIHEITPGDPPPPVSISYFNYGHPPEMRHQPGQQARVLDQQRLREFFRDFPGERKIFKLKKKLML
jgi:hypothetical protein